MKKIMALIVAVLMIVASFSMALAEVTYFADGDGSITVNNAVKGETYYAIKALSATVSSEGIAYNKPLPEQLATVFEVKTITEGTSTYEVIDKIAGKTDADVQAAMRAYANAHQSEWGDGVACTDNSVTFSGLDLGYYVIISTVVDTSKNQEVTTNKVSAGSTFGGADHAHTAAGQVYEKNDITVTVTKSADEKYSIGDTVEYTVEFNGVNYVGSGEDAEIIVKMQVQDTLPEFLSGATVTSVKVGDTEIINDLDVSKFATDKKFDIPWATGNKTDGYVSKYANGVKIQITYHATLTDIVKVDGTAGNKNVVKIVPFVDGPEGPEPREENWNDDHEIFTYAAALKKVDSEGNTLKGAKFQFYGLTAAPETAGGKGIYRVTAYSATDAVAKTEGTELEVGDDGMLYILGISSEVTLTGTETVAPKGYNLLTSDVTLTAQELGHEVWSSAGTRVYDADDNLVSESSTSTHNVTVTKTIDDLKPNAVTVVNKAGAELPSTGGMGTTILYVGGSILVLLAVILLVTKRRMNANDD